MTNTIKCPHCGFVTEYGRTVCIGCQVEVVYGATSRQTGVYGIVGMFAVWLLVIWLGGVMFGEGSIVISYFGGLLLGLIASGIGSNMAKNKYRDQITFFRRYRNL